MLEIKNISKTYETKDLKQTALNKVSINFRKNEFASILGPSGSGKTTLLNIIGGLDHYDKGDLIINEVSTKRYKDRDWDSYRNHRVGFVFQSYNLITHQSILQNVELALTLSGVSKKERTKKAKRALKEVGLEKHIHKRPNQLSGGQMQRVAIARALVNDPDILLADEPTGALDSQTSEQIMNLLKEVAKDKLVIMVTHNPELAEKYSTRIIKLKDGVIVDDSNPYDGYENTKESELKNKQKSKKTSMNLKTALSLSLNNLMTKKGRTILTSFAGSIGIIGIALILSLSNGVQNYIDKTQKEALSNYPIQIQDTNMDFTNLIEQASKNNSNVKCEDDKICTVDDITNSFEITTSVATTKNNLTDFKKYLDDNNGNIKSYVTDIQYVYDIDMQIYSSDTERGIYKVNPNTFSLSENNGMYGNGISIFRNNNVFKEMINNDSLINGQYELIAGSYPKNYNELVLIVDKNSQIPATLMYSLNIEDRLEVKDIVEKAKNKEDVSLESINYDYNDLLNKTFKLVLNTDYYALENNSWINKTTDMNYLKDIVEKGTDLKIVGIMKSRPEAKDATSGYIGYTHALSEYVINSISSTELAREQLNSKDTNILTNMPFDGFTSTYESVCKELGIANLDSPNTINIYPKDFEAKESIEEIIETYNETQDKENKITYTDMVGLLLTSLTSIVNVISYILIAFVAVSLVVSSIMISIITYISVLERTKEIGILRAIGASKKDISRVFNAETLIEGLCSGFLGVLIAYLLTIPVNSIVRNALEINEVAKLELSAAIILIIISVILTVTSGLVPARMASKKDPVESLRSE